MTLKIFDIFDRVQFDTNELSVSAIETSVLRDLWIARFGDDWVQIPLGGDDAFYNAALYRFFKDGQIESTYLMSEWRTMIRLKRTEDNNASR